MLGRRVGMVTLAAVLTVAMVGALHAQDKKYPDWRGEWGAAFPRLPGQQLRFDPSKPFGKGQEAPLTDEYKKVYENNLGEIARGRQGLFLYHASCLPAGMPTMMSAGDLRVHRHAGDHLHPGRHRCPPDFHRRAPVADGPAADLSGLLDRTLAR